MSKFFKYCLSYDLGMKKKSLDSSPDETRTFEKGKIDLVNLGEITIGRGYLSPDGVGKNALNPS